MGVFDKLKGAVKAVTGGAAKVSIEYPNQTVFPGEPVNVRVTVISTGGEVKSKGVFVDLVGEEHVSAHKQVRCPRCGNQWSEAADVRHEAAKQSFPLSPALVILAPNETRMFEGSFQIPGGAQPSYSGPSARFEWSVRGRLDAFGNDPDSGYQSLRVGSR